MSEPTLSKGQRLRFRRAVKALNDLRDEVLFEIPGANYYLQEDTLIFLSGPSHEGMAGRAQEHRELISARLLGSSGGGW
jgi:hypothetical protein